MALNGETGAVTLTSGLADITEDTILQLTAMAEDHGEPPLSSTGQPESSAVWVRLTFWKHEVDVCIDKLNSGSVCGTKICYLLTVQNIRGKSTHEEWFDYCIIINGAL